MAKKKEEKTIKRRNYFNGSSDIGRNIDNKEVRKRYFIITEGETEYFYFKTIREKLDKLSRGLIELEPKESKNSSINQIMNEANDKTKINHLPYTKIFPVFDRDSGSNLEDVFNNAILNPGSDKIHTLYTNPCIEYWLYIHLKDSKTASCKDYQKELTQIFRQEYDKTDPENLNRILKINPKGIIDAILRAERINHSADLKLPPSKRIPSTNVPDFFYEIAEVLYEPKDSDSKLTKKKLQEEKLKVFLFQV